MKLDSGPSAASLEALLYRGESPLYHELKIVYADLIGGDVSALERASALIRRHTKMDITLRGVAMADKMDMFVTWTTFDINSILRDPSLNRFEGMHVDVSLIRSILESSQGSVDEKGAVHGIYRKIPAVLTITEATWAPGGFTADELAACTLHEVGHLYSYFDVLGRTLATAIAIKQTTEELSRTTDLAQRVQIVDNVAKALEYDVDAVELAQRGQEETLQYVFLRDAVVRITADQGDAKLFGAETEFMADSYAVRSGAAKALASGFLKISKHYNDLHTLSRLTYITLEALKISTFLILAIIPTFQVAAGIMAALAIAMVSGRVHSRNTTAERLEAMHSELVAILKDTSLDQDQKEALLADANFLSALREQVTERSTLVMGLWRSLLPSHRKVHKQIQVQREIGKLVHNDLFVKAAKLSTL